VSRISGGRSGPPFFMTRAGGAQLFGLNLWTEGDWHETMVDAVAVCVLFSPARRWRSWNRPRSWRYLWWAVCRGLGGVRGQLECFLRRGARGGLCPGPAVGLMAPWPTMTEPRNTTSTDQGDGDQLGANIKVVIPASTSIQPYSGSEVASTRRRGFGQTGTNAG